MLIEQITEFELKGSGPPGRTCSAITGYFHDKTKISKENLQMDYYLLLNYCKRQRTFTSPNLGQTTNKISHQNARFLTCFGLKSQVKGELNNLIFSIGFQIKKLVL